MPTMNLIYLCMCTLHSRFFDSIYANAFRPFPIFHPLLHTLCLAHICMVNIFAACLHSSTLRCGLNDIVVVFTISVMLVGFYFFR